MQTTWNSIPTELLSNVFSYFDHTIPSDVNALFECIKTCRNWKPIAEKFAYSRIHLDQLKNKQIYKSCKTFEERLLLWLRSIKYDKRYNYVKFVNLGSNALDPHILRGCCTAFPRLEEIASPVKEEREKFFGNLLETLNQSKLPYLKILPKPMNDTALLAYAKCVLLLRGSATHLFLGDSPTNSASTIIFEKPYSILEKRLDTFLELTHLDIIRQSSQSIECFDYIIDTCKKLEDVKLAVISRGTKYSPPPFVNISDIVPRPQIKRLFISAPINSEQSLRYIMQKYPNLESMYVYASNNTGDSHGNNSLSLDKLITYSSSLLCNFFLFCAKIRSFRVNIPTPTAIAIQALYDYLSTTPNKQQTLTIFCFPTVNDVHESGCVLFGATHDGVRLCCGELSWPIESSRSPFLILKKCGSFIHRLAISNADDCNDFWVDINKEDYGIFKEGDCINSITGYCPRLESLDIENIFFGKYNDDCEYITNTSVKKLTLASCGAREHILSKIIHTFPLLDTLKLDNHLFDVGTDARKFTINASCCDLKQFHIREDMYRDYRERENILVFVSIEQDGLENRFFVSSKFDSERKRCKLNECSQEQFNTYHESKSNLAFYLKFKSIKTVAVETCNVTYKITL